MARRFLPVLVRPHPSRNGLRRHPRNFPLAPGVSRPPSMLVSRKLFPGPCAPVVQALEAIRINFRFLPIHRRGHQGRHPAARRYATPRCPCGRPEEGQCLKSDPTKHEPRAPLENHGTYNRRSTFPENHPGDRCEAASGMVLPERRMFSSRFGRIGLRSGWPSGCAEDSKDSQARPSTDRLRQAHSGACR